MTIVTNSHIRKRQHQNITNADLRKLVREGWYIRGAWSTPNGGYVIDFEKVIVND